jgi:hypothetical protein
MVGDILFAVGAALAGGLLVEWSTVRVREKRRRAGDKRRY